MVWFASEDQSFQAPSGADDTTSVRGTRAGAVVFEPSEEAAVMLPSVTKTKSCGWMWMISVLAEWMGDV